MNRFWQYDPLKQQPRLAVILLGGIFLLALYLRVVNLTTSPPGFYLDEASNGYNAYSVLKTGKDEHGTAWPLFFRSFGDYRGSVFIYSLVPLIGLKGLTVETIRLGAAIWGWLAVVGVAGLAWLVSSNLTFTSLAALVLALTPWHVHFSRMAHEAIALPALLVWFLVAWLVWFRRRKRWWGVISGVILGLSFYTYQTAKLWSPLLAIIVGIFFVRPLKKRWQRLWPLILGGMLMLVPTVWWSLLFPGSLTDRFSLLSIWADKPGLGLVADRFLKSFASHWSFDFLFGVGDLTIRSSSKVSSELLYSWGGFLVLGLVAWWKFLRSRKAWQAVLFMVVMFPLAASLTQTSPHAIRTLQAVPFFSLIVALGMYWLVKSLRSKKTLLILTVVLLAMVVDLEFSSYYRHLMAEYPKMAWMPKHGFDGSLVEALNWAKEYKQETGLEIYLSDQMERGYIQGLFFTQADPKTWQEKGEMNFGFKSLNQSVGGVTVAVMTKAECDQITDKSLVIRKFSPPFQPEWFDYCAVRY